MSEEFVPHNNNFAPHIAEYTQSNEALADPTTRRDYFEHMSGDDFIDMTQEIASIVRTGDSNQRQHYDGMYAAFRGHEVPDHREKEGLLRETWDTAQEFLRDRKLSDDDALEYAALTVAGGLLLTHPYVDGNGRTSRYLSYIMARGGQDVETLNRMSTSQSPEWRVLPSQRIALPMEQAFTGEQPGRIDWEPQLASGSKDALGSAITTTRYQDVVVRKFIETADDQTRQLIDTCATRDEDGRIISLNGDKLLSVLVNDPERGMVNGRRLIDLKRQFQADFVQRYLAGMRSDRRDEMSVLKRKDLRDVTDPYLTPNERVKIQTIAKVVGERVVDGRISRRDEAVAEHRGYSNVHTRQSS
jgi:hypothetical protein